MKRLRLNVAIIATAVIGLNALTQAVSNDYKLLFTFLINIESQVKGIKKQEKVEFTVEHSEFPSDLQYASKQYEEFVAAVDYDLAGSSKLPVVLFLEDSKKVLMGIGASEASHFSTTYLKNSFHLIPVNKPEDWLPSPLPTMGEIESIGVALQEKEGTWGHFTTIKKLPTVWNKADKK